MTEEEWSTSTLPHVLIEFLRIKMHSHVPRRKLRLFLCGCCRLVPDEAASADRRLNCSAVENFAEGVMSTGRLIAIRKHHESEANSPNTLDWALRRALLSRDRFLWDETICGVAVAEILEVGRFRTEMESAEKQRWRRIRDKGRVQIATLFRDIFGNPFRPVTFDPRWRTSDVVDLARGIYEDKAFERMPILADALMDAGCEDEQIIGHCRGDGPHVRGCWVVDLILDKL